MPDWGRKVIAFLRELHAYLDTRAKVSSGLAAQHAVASSETIQRLDPGDKDAPMTTDDRTASVGE